MVHILMLLWQHAWFQSPASSKLNITICKSTMQNTRSYLRRMPVPPSLGRLFNIFSCTLCPMQLQMRDQLWHVLGARAHLFSTSCAPNDPTTERMPSLSQASTTFPLINHLPRIIAPPLTEIFIFKIIAFLEQSPPSSLFSLFFYPLPFKLKIDTLGNKQAFI